MFHKEARQCGSAFEDGFDVRTMQDWSGLTM